MWYNNGGGCMWHFTKEVVADYVIFYKRSGCRQCGNNMQTMWYFIKEVIADYDIFYKIITMRFNI